MSDLASFPSLDYIERMAKALENCASELGKINSTIVDLNSKLDPRLRELRGSIEDLNAKVEVIKNKID